MNEIDALHARLDCVERGHEEMRRNVFVTLAWGIVIGIPIGFAVARWLT